MGGFFICTISVFTFTLYIKVLSMDSQIHSSKTLQDIRDMMEKSARFISLSGWSGIWAGMTGLVGAYIAHTWLKDAPNFYRNYNSNDDLIRTRSFDPLTVRFILLAIVVLVVALIGGYYFTWRKTRRSGNSLWSSASRRMLFYMAIPMVAGAAFSLLFLKNGHEGYIASTCLVFYGLALINGSKYTLSDIRYLGYCEFLLGILAMFIPLHGLIFWAIGFGALHIIYGVIMWRKYDMKNTVDQ